ncbi:MAG: membrane protein insertion efficiency factor YidD [Ignavibacteriales bacterium]|nr:membrane protein insertion efficiency factor YidD [Ignavibacteriales bacterium]
MRFVFVYFIKIYQKLISPLFPPSCRFYPSCSEYSRQAFEKYGVFKGGYKSVWRILRCNPFNKGGYDPLL